MAKRQDLIDAVNLIASYVEDNLPGDFEIVLKFDATEATATLFDHSGREVPDSTSGDDSVIVEMCDAAKGW